MSTPTPQGKIAIMEVGGEALGKILQELLDFSRPGVTLFEIEAKAQQRIKEAGMKPSFSTVADYQWATCLCVNDVIVHGIPTSYALREGDVFTIDIGLINQGYHSDTAWTKVVGSNQRTENGKQKEINRFLETGKEALAKAIEQAKIGNRVGHISEAIQDVIEGSGYGIVKSLVGHGIGTTLHEAPQIPGYLKGAIEKTPALTPGMTLAIEVIYTMGNPTVCYLEDEWSIATRDHSLSAVFEQSIAVTQTGPRILTPKPQ